MFPFAFLFQRNINENFITIIYTHHSKKANKVIETDSIYFLIFSEPWVISWASEIQISILTMQSRNSSWFKSLERNTGPWIRSDITTGALQFADGITVFYSQYTQLGMDVLLRSQSTTALPDRLTQINLYPNTFLPLKCARHRSLGYTKEECLGFDFILYPRNIGLFKNSQTIEISIMI